MKKLIILTILITILTGTEVFAQVSTSNNPAQNNSLPSYTLLEPLPCIPSPAAKDINGNTIPGSEVTCATPGATQETVNFKFYVQYMFNLFIAVAAAAAVFMIIFGGLQYMSTDSWNGKEDGINKMKNALLGLLLVLTSFIILRTINPNLVAIPTTLVPPLNIKYDAVNSSLFESLRKDSEQLRVNSAETKQKLVEAENRNSSRQQEIDQANIDIADLKDLGAGDDDPQVLTLKAKIDTLNNEIKRETAGAALTLGKSSLDNTIYGVNPLLGNSGPNNFITLRENLDRIFIIQSVKIKSAGAEADQIQEFDRYRIYSKASVDMNEVVAKVAQVRVSYDGSTVALKNATNQKIAEQKIAAEAELTKIYDKNIASLIGDADLYAKINQKRNDLKEMLATIHVE